MYHVSEKSFRPKYENANVEQLIKDAKDMTQETLQNRNIDLSIEVDHNVPETISSDLNKLQQVILNLLLSIINNKIRGSLKIKVSKKQIIEYQIPCINIDFINSKVNVNESTKKLQKLTKEKDFSKILEADVDVNYKIAKILSNAMDWKINFKALD